MATYATIIQNGHSVNSVYPRAGFIAIFLMTDGSYKWQGSATKYALVNLDQKLLVQDIDSAINNLENLDLA